MDLLYFKPERTDNKDQETQYKKNIFSAIRQYHFTSSANARNQEDDRQSIDIVICLNGFSVITLELKHTLAGQSVIDAVEQYTLRDTERPIFYRAFVHIATDDEKAKIATTFSKPPTKEDFREFNTGLLNKKIAGEDYAVQYLYNEILEPDSVLNFIERYLYGTTQNWIFPRYHQQRCVKRIYEDISEHYSKKKSLTFATSFSTVPEAERVIPLFGWFKTCVTCTSKIKSYSTTSSFLPTVSIWTTKSVKTF